MAVGTGATTGGCEIAVGGAGSAGVGVLTAPGRGVEVGVGRVGLGVLVGVLLGPITIESDCPANAST